MYEYVVFLAEILSVTILTLHAVLLQDTLGRLLDQKIIRFDTKELVPVEGDPTVDQNGTKKEKGESGNIWDKLFGGGSTSCSSCKL